MQQGRAGQGYLLCGDDPKWFAGKEGTWGIEAGGTWPKMTIDEPFGRITLRRGETYIRTWRPGKYFFREGWLERDGCGPIHHCGPADRKDTANWFLYEPHADKPPVGSRTGNTYYRIYAVGRLEYIPDLADTYRDAVSSASNIQTCGEGTDAALTQADASRPAEVIFSVACPYVLTAGEFSAATTQGNLAVTVSTDAGKTWQPIALTRTDTAITAEFIDPINGSRDGYLLKITLADGAVLKDFALTSHFQLNRYSLPYLAPGRNVVSVTAGTFDAPLRVEYTFCEAPGWDKSRTVGQTFTEPGEFVIDVAGEKYPRMESLTLRVDP